MWRRNNHILKYLIERGLRCLNVSQTDIEAGFARKGIPLESHLERCYDLEETFSPLFAFGFQFIVDSFAQEIDKLCQ